MKKRVKLLLIRILAIGAGIALLVAISFFVFTDPAKDSPQNYEERGKEINDAETEHIKLSNEVFDQKKEILKAEAERDAENYINDPSALSEYLLHVGGSDRMPKQ